MKLVIFIVNLRYVLAGIFKHMYACMSDYLCSIEGCLIKCGIMYVENNNNVFVSLIKIKP